MPPLPLSVVSSYSKYTVAWARRLLPNLERRSRMARDISVHDSLLLLLLLLLPESQNP